MLLDLLFFILYFGSILEIRASDACEWSADDCVLSSLSVIALRSSTQELCYCDAWSIRTRCWVIYDVLVLSAALLCLGNWYKYMVTVGDLSFLFESFNCVNRKANKS